MMSRLPRKVEVTLKKADENGKKETKGWETIGKILQTFLPAIGVFSALCYFLGRQYIESYYSTLGISPNILDFTTNDYMFFSFNMVIMCLVFSVLFFICWEWFITTEKTGSIFPSQIDRHKVLAFFILMVLFLACAAYYISFVAWPKAYINGVSGLCTGLGMGIVIVAIIIIINPKTGNKGKGMPIIVLLAVVIILFSIMPLVTRDLACAQAASDIKRFPVVEVITKETLPQQLQDGSTNWTNSVGGRLIIADEKMTYLSRLEERMGNMSESLNAIVPAEIEVHIVLFPGEKPPGKVTWLQTYAIPTDSIKDIIYYKKKE